jgi:hypothetical protein
MPDELGHPGSIYQAASTSFYGSLRQLRLDPRGDVPLAMPLWRDEWPAGWT